MPDLSPETIRAVLALRDRLEAAKQGESARLVGDFCTMQGVHPNTAYTWLRAHGYRSGRKPRADAGSTRLSAETLDFIAAARRESVRGNGKLVLPLGVAMNIADASGLDVNVSAGRIATLLRERRLDVETMQNARNHITLRSLFPNHLHQIDPSLCLLFYLRGEQRMMREQEFNKNKLAAYTKVKLKVWRYVRYDHASGSIDVRYYEAEGENQVNLFEFLLYTWGKQPHRLSHGRAHKLLWDKGSSNTSFGIRNLLDALGVEHETHAPGHAWGKGGVEQGNNLVETHFESRLRFEPVESIEALNAVAELWVRDYNANRIAHVDARLVRASGEPMVRDDLWSLILRHPGALVELPDRKVCQYFLRGKEDTRQVRDLKISFVHPELGKSALYDLRPWAEHLGQKMPVRVSPLLLREGMVRISVERLGQEPLQIEVAPERDFDAFGRPLSAVVVGEYARAKETADETAAKHLVAVAYGEPATLDQADEKRAKQAKPFAHLNDGRGAVAHSHLGQGELPTRLLPTAKPVNTPEVQAARGARIELAPLSLVEAAKRLKGRVGEAWTAESYRWLAQRHPNGVPEDALESIAEELTGPTAEKKQPLRLVAGA